MAALRERHARLAKKKKRAAIAANTKREIMFIIPTSSRIWLRFGGSLGFAVAFVA